MIGGRRILLRVDKTDDWGNYNHDEGVITLSPKALEKDSNLRETLRHEILHAALHIGGVAFLEQYEEEVIVRCINGVFWPAWERTRKLMNL